MPWSLVTAPDELERCSVLIDGVRCSQPTTHRIAGTPPAWADYKYTCGDHVELVASAPGYVVEPVPRGSIIGVRIGGPPAAENEHFIQCSVCKAWLDMRDLGALLAHEDLRCVWAGRVDRPAQDS